MVVHYLRRGTYKVLYEVDYNQPFVELVLKDYDALMGANAQIPRHMQRPNLEIIPKKAQNAPPNTGEEDANPET